MWIFKIRIENGDQNLFEQKGIVVIKTGSCNKGVLELLYVSDVDQNMLSIYKLVEKWDEVYV